MRSFVQVLTTPTADTPGTTLLLHFDNKRYLIGSLAEGTQRACVQMGARLLKLQECFVTGRTEWSNIGGMIGMILTLADVSAASAESFREEAMSKARQKGKRLQCQDDEAKMKQLEAEALGDVRSTRLSITGPPNLNHTLATARRFVFRKGMPVDIHEVRAANGKKGDREEWAADWAADWADSNIKVWTMAILPSPSADTSMTNGGSSSSPRKRRIDEVEQQNSTAQTAGADGLTQTEHDVLTTKAIVSEMFDSSWRLDTLFETPLSQVKLPASIFVRNATTNKVEKYQGPLPGSNKPLENPDLPVLVRKPWPGALVDHLPSTQPLPEAISYIVRSHKQRGKFLPARAEELKVRDRRLWGQLQSGQDVQNENGETIKSEMVMGETREGGGIAVIDLPNPSYIDNLINRPEWTEPRVMAGVGAIFWLCGKDVVADQRLQDFMQRFSHLQHIISSTDSCPNNIALDSVAAATIRMRAVDPVRYNVPSHTDVPAREDLQLPAGNVRLAQRGQKVQIVPDIEFQVDEVVPPLSIPEIEKGVSSEVLVEADKARSSIKADNASDWASSIPDRDAEVITLGTGSALPSKYRNVSATLVRVPGWGSMLFDAGENTIGQLRRVFPPDELRSVLQELRAIFISHMHADHHLGTASVIKAWYHEVHNGQPLPTPSPGASMQSLFENKKRLAVISEPAMQHWLSEYASVEDFGFSRIAPLHISPATPEKDEFSRLTWFIPPADLAHLSPGQRAARLNDNNVKPSLIGFADVQAVAVRHCHGARAFSATLPSGFKASYSGDCRPSKRFAMIGKDSTVCIHEATFDDELLGDAMAKNHSTTSEALGIAQAMKAKTCVLTHFSQRYQKLPVLEHNSSEEDETVSSTLDGAAAVEDEEDNDSGEDAEAAGVATDVAATFPDQTTTNGAGKQYDLPSKIAASGDGAASSAEPATVKLKLTSDMKVCMAFDYMRVKVGDIAELPYFTPALLKLFADEEDKEVKRKAAVHKALEQAAALKRGGKKKEKGQKGQKETQKEEQKTEKE